MLDCMTLELGYESQGCGGGYLGRQAGSQGFACQHACLDSPHFVRVMKDLLMLVPFTKQPVVIPLCRGGV